MMLRYKVHTDGGEVTDLTRTNQEAEMEASKLGNQSHALPAAMKKSGKINSENESAGSSIANRPLRSSENGPESLKFRGILEARIGAFRKIREITPAIRAGIKSLTDRAATVDRGSGPHWSKPLLNPIGQDGSQRINSLDESSLKAEADVRSDAVDGLDSDSMVEFPPSNAPEEIKEAWRKTMLLLDESEQFMALYLFMAQSIIANLQINADCEYRGISYPGDPDYKNIFSADLNDWEDLLENIDEYLAIEEEDFPGRKQQININRKIIATFRKKLREEIN